MTQAKEGAAAALDAAFADNKVDVLISVNNYHSALYATANYPAISVPLGLRANGMPVGVVLIGKPGEEAKLLSYAYALEQATKLPRESETDAEVITSGQALGGDKRATAGSKLAAPNAARIAAALLPDGRSVVMVKLFM